MVRIMCFPLGCEKSILCSVLDQTRVAKWSVYTHDLANPLEKHQYSLFLSIMWMIWVEIWFMVRSGFWCLQWAKVDRLWVMGFDFGIVMWIYLILCLVLGFVLDYVNLCLILLCDFKLKVVAMRQCKLVVVGMMLLSWVTGKKKNQNLPPNRFEEKFLQPITCHLNRLFTCLI